MDKEMNYALFNDKFDEKVNFDQKFQNNSRWKKEMIKKSSEDDEVLRCELCVKVFSGPIPFRQHMYSSSHIKEEFRKAIKKENNELQCSQQNHTTKSSKEDYLKVENITRPLEDSENNDVDDDNGIEGCNLCGIFRFNNMQYLIEHLKSTEHIKKMYINLNIK